MLQPDSRCCAELLTSCRAVPRCSRARDEPGSAVAELRVSCAVLLLLNRAADPGLGDPRSDALSVSVASESVGGVELGGLGSFLLLGLKDLIKIN